MGSSVGIADSFERKIKYLRVSVTDRCNFRCIYCMPETQSFAPKVDMLSLEEIEEICSSFISLGVRKLRLSGGEPLVRPGVIKLFHKLSYHLHNDALDELTLTTNASRLGLYAAELVAIGVKRVNISIDTLDPKKFQAITRRGNLPQILENITTAKHAGLKIKINMVALKGINDDEFDSMICWCGENGFDLTLIEVMPLGETGEVRIEKYLSLAAVRYNLEQRWTLIDSPHRTGGPAHYIEIKETQQKLGLITPLSNNFCDSCNRVRITCTGKLFMCLGQEDWIDLRQPLRKGGSSMLQATIIQAITRKPQGHNFIMDRDSIVHTVNRHMNVTGG